MASTVGTILVNVIGNASGLQSTLSAAESTVSKFGGNVTRAGARWTAGISLPLGALLGGIGKVGLEFDKAMTESLAIMDDADQSMRQQMTDTALDLSKKLKFSATDVAKGYYDLASAGFDAKGAIANIGTVATFAQAGLMDMEVAGEHLAGAVKALGTDLIGAKDDAGAMARVADVLTAANNNALGTVEDFSQALTTRFASGMRAANMGLADGVAFLMAFAQQNIKGKDASQQAWMALRDVQTATIRASDAWNKYGISVYDANNMLRPMPDILDQINMRMKGFSKSQIQDWLKTGVKPQTPEFGPMNDRERRDMLLQLKLPDRSVSALQKVLGQSDTIRDFKAKIENSFGEAERVAKKQGQSIEMQITMLWHRIQASAITMFETMKPVVRDFLQIASDGITVLEGWVTKFNSLDESTRKWVLGLAVGAVAFGPLLVILGNAITLVGTLMRLGGPLITLFNGISTGMARAVAATSIPKAGLDAWAKLELVVGNSWNAIKNLVKVGGELLPRIFALYGIVDLTKDAFKWLAENSNRWLDVLTGLFPPLGLVRTLWNRLVGDVKLSVGSWSDWYRTGVNIVRILGDIWTMARFGLSLIPRGLATLGEIWTETWNDMLNKVVDMWKGLDRFWSQLSTGLRNIPIIGDLFAGAWKLAGLMLGEFWEVVKTVFGWIVSMSKAVGLQLAKNIFPESIRNFGNLIYSWVTGTENFHSTVQDVADGFDAWLTKIGAIDIKSRQLKGTFEALKPVLTRTGIPIAGVIPAIPGLGAAPPPGEANLGSTKRDPVQEALDQLMGDGGRDWKNFAKAVEQNKKAVFENADAMDRLWEIYKGVRETIGPSGLTKELDELFAPRIALDDMEKMSKTFGDLWGDLYNNGEVQTELEKHLSLIGNFVREREALLKDAGAAGGPIFGPEFFEKYGSQIEQLSKHYSTQSREVKVMIDAYHAWKNEIESVERAGKNFLKSQEEFGKVVVAHADMAAKLKDKERELADSRLSENGRAIKGLTRNYDQQVLEFEKSNAEMLNSFKYMNDAELQMAVKKFLEIKKMQQDYLKATTEMDRERLATTVGINERVMASFRKMNEAQQKNLIQTKATANQVANSYRDIAAGMSTLASVFDEKGTKTLTWLRDLTALMGESAQAGADLKIGFSGMKEAMAAGDWAAFAGSAIASFQALANGISVMDRATQSANRMRATIGGAATGAQMGAAFGPYGALIGGIIGGAVGFFRSAGRAAEEARLKVQGFRDQYTQMMLDFYDSHKEFENIFGILQAFGFEFTQINNEADLKKAQEAIRQFEEKLAAVRGKFKDLLTAAQETGIGIPDALREAIQGMVDLGIITGDVKTLFDGLLKQGELDWKKVKEAADRYGLTEDKLGKAYQQARMDSLAKQMINDYDLLTRAGADSDEVLKAMKGQITSLVLDSKKFGTTIPENMKPWIERMIELGLLFDENGNKIENMDGIKFGPKIKTQFEEITQAILDLIEELKKLPGLLTGLPTPPGPGTGGGGGTEGGAPGGGGGGGGNTGGEGPPNGGLFVPTGSSYNGGNVVTRAGGTSGTLSASSGVGGGGSTVIVLPVAVGDATSIEDLAEMAVASLPEQIADNRNNIKYAIVSAARATSVPRTRKR